MSGRDLGIADGNEPIPPLGDRPWDGPDLRDALPVADMLEWLAAAAAADLSSYVRVWRYFAHSAGGNVGFLLEQGKAPQLVIGCPVDAQRRHRLLWLHHLTEDLFARDGGREALEDAIRHSPYAHVERPRDPGTMTKVMRAFLRAGGRILVDPEGEIEEGFGNEATRRFSADTDPADWNELSTAGRAYFRARSVLDCDDHIIRAVTMLGRRYSNGWYALERPAAAVAHITETLA
ncbi:hypothetical protein J2Y58_002926 [Sphingomonas sp. BE138]|uniref:hypothetical protein n=1 Tax=Sphingomonas sp. BE138 TaxID=2817845 RepID=UPI00285836A5|nr:hypothetical protein [Sphingomonas sp. BE138]MDR6789553.1 hypothetical protein [Sphingomonas sp. BE138]